MLSTLQLGRSWKQNCTKLKVTKVILRLERTSGPKWQNYWEKVNWPVLQVFQPQSWMWHLTSKNLGAELLITHIQDLHGISDMHMIRRLIELLMGCEPRILHNLLPAQFESQSLRTCTSTLKSCLQHLSPAMTLMTLPKILQVDLPLSKRRMYLSIIPSKLDWSGTRSLQHG